MTRLSAVYGDREALSSRAGFHLRRSKVFLHTLQDLREAIGTIGVREVERREFGLGRVSIVVEHHPGHPLGGEIRKMRCCIVPDQAAYTTDREQSRDPVGVVSVRCNCRRINP